MIGWNNMIPGGEMIGSHVINIASKWYPFSKREEIRQIGRESHKTIHLGGAASRKIKSGGETPKIYTLFHWWKRGRDSHIDVGRWILMRSISMSMCCHQWLVFLCSSNCDICGQIHCSCSISWHDNDQQCVLMQTPNPPTGSHDLSV